MKRLSALLILVLGVTIEAQDSSETQQRQDLGFLAERINAIHPAPADSAEKQAFRQQIDQLQARSGRLDSVTFAIELARVIALLHDAHTRLLLNSIQPPPRALPIQVGIFSEGLIVTATTERYRAIAGARVVSVGRHDVSEALKRLSTLISAENESWIRQAAPQRLVLAEILRYLGAIGDVERVPLHAVIDGTERDVTLEVLPRGVRPEWVDARGIVSPAPLRRQHPARKHWFEPLQDSRALYFQYNEVADDGPRSVAVLAADLKREFSNGRYERLIVDLRNNGGGNNLLNRDLLQALIQMPGLRDTGRLIVLIGRNTFSAGAMFALDLEYHFNPVFIGEPTGGSPNFFAEPATITLPNSKLQVFCATAQWQYSDPRDRRLWIGPLVSVDPLWADETSGQDAALKEALTWTPEPGLPTVLQNALDARGRAGLLDAYRTFVANPRHRWFDTEGGLTTVGFRLLRSDRVAEAISVFELNTSEHPMSATAYANLGNALLRSGDRDRARTAFQRARGLNPKDAGILAALDALSQ